MRPPFQRVMVLNASPEPDFELLRYSAKMVRGAVDPAMIVAAQAGEAAMRFLAPCSRLALAGCPEAELSFRVMLEPHLDLLFEMAEESECDLIVARHPRGSEQARGLIARFLYDAPCAVCLVPKGAECTLRRPMVRVEPTARGRELLSAAAAFSRAAGSDELLAVHPYFRTGMDLQLSSAAPDDERILEFYRFLARTDLSGVSCTLLLEENSRQAAGLLRLARERGSDLLIVDPDADRAPVWQWNRREAGALANSVHVALLSLRVARNQGLVSILREQVFCEMEPTFN
jgi:hypothetical protein